MSFTLLVDLFLRQFFELIYYTQMLKVKLKDSVMAHLWRGFTWTMQLHCCRTEERKWQCTTNPIKSLAVTRRGTASQNFSKKTIESHCLPSHVSSGGKHKRSKWSLLHFSDTIIILSSLLKFMASIQGGDYCVAVAWCIWVEYPYIYKKGIPPPSISWHGCLILTVDYLGFNNLSC